MEFEYDPDLIRELALELVCPGTMKDELVRQRYQVAGIEYYCEVYSEFFMEDIAMGWDEARGDSPAWSELDNRQRHKVIATVAMYHESADQSYFDDQWTSRIAGVFEDDIAGDAESVIR